MTLATAITIDYDYFSRTQGGWFPFMYMGGAPVPPPSAPEAPIPTPVPDTPANAPVDTSPVVPPSSLGEDVMQDKAPTWDTTESGKAAKKEEAEEQEAEDEEKTW